jgi:alpha-beta hydrolase superfamily lysophospholipase
MDESTLTFTAADGTEIHAYRWTPDEPAKAIVQIAHGMGEHAGRYRRLGEALTEAGYVAYANDHRGHGRTAGSPDNYGDLGPGGWSGLVGDLAALSEVARREHPGLPLVMLGHSMGSFALQQYLLEHGADVDAAVLSGTTAVDVVAPSFDATQDVDLSTLNAPFEPARTEFDWLSRDPGEVDKYVADAACGFGLNPDGTRGMLAVLSTYDAQALAKIPSSLPIYIVSGDDDPLAGGGPLVDLVGDRYREAGVLDVTVARYPAARHEVFNETNRDEITAALIEWLDRVTDANAS